MDAAQARDELIRIAHTIAKQQRGEDHLQDFDTIRLKLLHEYQEFEEARATKSRLDALSELADLLYYSCQEFTYDGDQRDLDSTVAYLSKQVGVTSEQAYTAALTKYRLRSAKPDNQNFEAENAAIETALQEGRKRMTEREFMEQDAVLRGRWNDETLSDEEREQAGAELRALVAEYSKEHPPITGIFYYTQEEEEKAKRHGF